MSHHQIKLTQQPAFLALQQLKIQEQSLSLTQRFASEPNRFNQFCEFFEDSLQVDFSRQHWQGKIMKNPYMTGLCTPLIF